MPCDDDTYGVVVATCKRLILRSPLTSVGKHIHRLTKESHPDHVLVYDNRALDTWLREQSSPAPPVVPILAVAGTMNVDLDQLRLLRERADHPERENDADWDLWYKLAAWPYHLLTCLHPNPQQLAVEAVLKPRRTAPGLDDVLQFREGDGAVLGEALALAVRRGSAYPVDRRESAASYYTARAGWDDLRSSRLALAWEGVYAFEDADFLARQLVAGAETLSGPGGQAVIVPAPGQDSSAIRRAVKRYVQSPPSEESLYTAVWREVMGARRFHNRGRAVTLAAHRTAGNSFRQIARHWLHEGMIQPYGGVDDDPTESAVAQIKRLWRRIAPKPPGSSGGNSFG